MDTITILAKITGIIFFILSVRSIIKHFKKESKEAKEAENQSKIELFLNTAILYLWFFFTLAFSIGMVVNN